MNVLKMAFFASCASMAFVVSALDFSGIFPPDVKCVYIVAPSSHAKKEVVEQATNALIQVGYKVKVSEGVWHYTADAAQRARYLEAAWQDPETDLILCSRGGKGGFATVTNLNFEIIKSREVPFVGFSNISCLMNAFVARGVKRPITGPMCTSLVSYPTTRDSIRRLGATVARKPLEPTQLDVLRAPAQAVHGKPLGGHWPSISQMTKEWLPSTDGRVVFLEINKTYTLETAMSSFQTLKGKGYFANPAALVLCEMGITGTKEEKQKLVSFIVESVSCPVFKGYPYGHVRKLYAIDYDRDLSITPAGKLSWE